MSTPRRSPMYSTSPDPLSGATASLPAGAQFAKAPVDNLPTAGTVALQILFYAMLAFILTYLVSHWVFHSWSFVNIYRMGVEKRAKLDASWSDKATPALVVVMFLLYTHFMDSFTYFTVVTLQFSKYSSSFYKITAEATRHRLDPLMYCFLAMAMFPVVVNMVVAIIKLSSDWLYARGARKDFHERKDAFLRSQGLLLPPAGVSDEPPAPVHTPAAVSGAAENGLPLVYVLIPTYNEPLPNLMGAINGVAASDYPRLRVFVGFDNYDVEQQFFTLCRLMTGVPLRSESVAKRFSELRWRAPQAAAATAAVEDDIDPSNLSHKAVLGRMGCKSQKYNGFDQIVTAAGSIRSVASVPQRSSTPPLQFTPLSSRPSSMAPTTTMTAGDLGDATLLDGGADGLYSASLAGDSALNLGNGGVFQNRPRRTELDFTAEDCPDAYTLEYRSTQITVCRFEHSGKLGTQRNMFERLQQELENEGHVEDPYILFMDSDTAIMPDTVSQLVAEVQRRPQTRAVTGMVVSRNEDCYNFWRIMQDAEYIESMIFRNAEALMGAVTCLPGVLTMFKYPVLLDVAQDYFYQREIASTFDFAQRYLGEDRYMTHLLMERPGTYTLGFNSQAMCKTEAPSNFNNLLRQRRRWFLGTITNELIMLCTPLFWRKYPLLMLTKFFQILKVGGAITYILLVELLFNLIFDYSTFKWDYLVWLLIVIIPNWLFVTVWAVLEKRLKAVLVFPAYYFFNPFFMISILLYSFLTVRQRTWGGPRAAAATDEDEENVAADGDEEDDVGAIRHDGAPLETVVVVNQPQIAPAAH
ncbi:hypothetical protein H9P43_006398 [Blastocladiella emersonii ATCC 22665]|nr:hypothetical protein H9P43_006398 [Blastocladiella emersonii ATCC 22665]